MKRSIGPGLELGFLTRKITSRIISSTWSPVTTWDGSLGSRLSYRSRPIETDDDDEASIIDTSLCSEMFDCD